MFTRRTDHDATPNALTRAVRELRAELASMERLQRWLREALGHRAITIESNPSSNWLIADMLDIRNHPSLRLQPLDSQSTEGPPLALSINTDNPLTFATCLVDEYAYLYAAMSRAAIPTSDVLAWLDRVREAGWRSRFTLPPARDNARFGRRPRS